MGYESDENILPTARLHKLVVKAYYSKCVKAAQEFFDGEITPHEFEEKIDDLHHAKWDAHDRLNAAFDPKKAPQGAHPYAKQEDGS